MESAFEKWLNSTVPGYREAWDAALEEAKTVITVFGSRSDHWTLAELVEAIRELKEQK